MQNLDTNNQSARLYKWVTDLCVYAANHRGHMAQQFLIMHIMQKLLEEDDLMEELHARVEEATGEPMPDLRLSYSLLFLAGPDLGVGDEMLKTLRNLIKELDEKQAFLDASINLLHAKQM